MPVLLYFRRYLKRFGFFTLRYRGFNGKISELKYYNRALDSDELYSIYRAGYQTFSFYDKINSIKPNVSVSASISSCVSN